MSASISVAAFQNTMLKTKHIVIDRASTSATASSAVLCNCRCTSALTLAAARGPAKSAHRHSTRLINYLHTIVNVRNTNSVIKVMRHSIHDQYPSKRSAQRQCSKRSWLLMRNYYGLRCCSVLNDCRVR